MEGNDPLLTVAEVAALIGWTTGAWRAEVSTGRAPAADDPDADRPANRRMPRWRRSTVIEWKRKRPGRGRRRTEEGT